MKKTKLAKKFLFLIFTLMFCFSINIFGQIVIERKNSNKETREKQAKGKENGSTLTEAKNNTFEIEQKILDLFNKKRIEQKAKPLFWNEKVAIISRQHSESMSKENFFGLKGKDGKTIKDQFVDAGTVNWTNFGRLIASGTEIERIAEETVERWFSSEPRRRYLLNSIWLETGIGVFVDKDGKIFITQDFLGK